MLVVITPTKKMATRLMKAAVLKVRASPPVFEIQQIPIPSPGPGEVLVKIDSSPINPSDLGFIAGNYPTPKPHPCIAGFEGSGTVVSNGGGLLGWTLVGKRVACLTDLKSFSGTWAEYMVTPAKICVKLADDVSLEEGCSFFVNPLTVVMFSKFIQTGKHQAVIHNAAASALGKMLNKHLQRQGVPLINIVRRQEQVDTLRALGAEYVLDSSQEGFAEQLTQLSTQLNATIGFDAIGGEETGVMFNALQPGGTVHVYGALSGRPVSGLNIGDFITKDKHVKGAWVTTWIPQQGLVGTLGAMSTVQKHIKTDFSSKIANRFGLDHLPEALAYYKDNMSAGKTLIKPGS
jgi:NADPH:quinone reductase-like Zn-dependent oxidoreductase